MSDENKGKPRVFLRDLLFLEVLKSTRPDAPKNSKAINRELERRWRNLFPDEPFPQMGLKTIINHVKDMKLSGFYDVKVHHDNRRGYYIESDNGKATDKIIFTPAEIIIMANALYRSPSVSIDVLKKFLRKLNSLTDADGSSYVDFLTRHLNKWGTLYKTKRDILPIVEEIWRELLDHRPAQKFCFDYRGMERVVSAYFFVWESDELYLIAGEDPNHLSHFKVSDIKNLMLLDFKFSLPLREVEFYGDCANEGPSKERGGLTTNFPLNRYVAEHVFMADGDIAPTKITLQFSGDFKNEILARFGTSEKILQPRLVDAEQKIYTVTVTAQENDGLYRWLMQFADRVKVVKPKDIRNELRYRLNYALEMLE